MEIDITHYQPNNYYEEKQKWKGMGVNMNGYIDIHSHILPGVDDGAKDMDETCKMLTIAYKEGIRVIVATPHYITGVHNVASGSLHYIFKEASKVVKEAGIDIRMELGNELLYSLDLIDALKRGDALTLGGTRYILLEFMPDISYEDIRKGLSNCIYSGYIPIIAHAERYETLIKTPGMVAELIRLGSCIQINMYNITGSIVDSRVKFCHKLLKNSWVHFLGTDAHGINERAPHAREAVNYITKKCGDRTVRQLLWDNPMMMLDNQLL